ncbi:TPR-like protein [Armillaria gallica]|uniref:TPR-like protein n=1 Tax=Armillaria gallica TaxID=47427 RepID=A0A2H3D7F5_ARMGA|nr:TPR-like protein [Armillaria gallica]
MLPEAIRIMQEVIRIESRAVSAWSVWAQSCADMNQEHRALQLRIMAAHLRHDAEEWDRLARQSKIFAITNKHCTDRATLAKDTGDLRTVASCLILDSAPRLTTILAELRTILIELSDLTTCTSLFQQAFDHYQQLYPSGRGPSPSSTGEIAGGGYGLMEVLVLADLYNTLGEYESAIDVIWKGCRWLLGRADQRYWDVCDDDREYDLPDVNMPRRAGGTIDPGRYPLDVNARHRLAIARIKMGEMHADIVLSEDVLDYAALFVEIADVYFERELYADARPIYELLGADASMSSLYEKRLKFMNIKIADPTHNEAKMKLAEIYEILNEPRKALELVYEVIDSRKKRPKDKTATQAEDPATASLFPEERTQPRTKPAVKAQNRLTHAQFRELEVEKEKEIVRGYRRLQEVWAKMMEANEVAEREWMVEAEKMVETFRETRNLFMTSRNNGFRGMFPRRPKKQRDHEEDEDRMVSRLHLDLENDSMSEKASRSDKKDEKIDIFRGVSFDDWLRVFMQYCFILTKWGQYDLADEVLRHILLSNAYQSKELQSTIRLALLACAIASKNFVVVVELCRKLINIYQFNNEPLRLLLATLSSGLRPTDAFITSTLQKHLFREMKLGDAAVKNSESLRWNQANKRHATINQSKAEDDDVEDEGPIPELPTKQNPVIVAIYGQICIAAKSYQSAIFYLLHAYDYCPDDPMICLSLAIASLGRAMQRQSDNRHHLIAQALAFLSRYRAIRGTNLQGQSEVEYNFGRSFHQLSLYSHAAKHYERVLQLAEQSTEETFAKEAAYNLALIYVMTGATPLAAALYDRWLSI